MLRRLFFLKLFTLFVFGASAQEQIGNDSIQQFFIQPFIKKAQKKEPAIQVPFNPYFPSTVAAPPPPPGGGDGDGGGTGGGGSSNDPDINWYGSSAFTKCPSQPTYTTNYEIAVIDNVQRNTDATWSATNGTIVDEWITQTETVSGTFSTKHYARVAWDMSKTSFSLNGALIKGYTYSKRWNPTITYTYNINEIDKKLTEENKAYVRYGTSGEYEEIVGSNLCYEGSRIHLVDTLYAGRNFSVEVFWSKSINGGAYKSIAPSESWADIGSIRQGKYIVEKFYTPIAEDIGNNVKFRMSYRLASCTSESGSIVHSDFTIYRSPTAEEGTHDPPTCSGGNDGKIRFTNVSADFKSYIISIYKGLITDTPIEVLNIEKDDALTGNSITLESGMPIANIIDDAGNSSTTSRKLQLDAGIYTVALEPNEWLDGEAVPENVCHKVFEVEVPPSPVVEFDSKLNDGQAKLDLMCSDDLASFTIKANRAGASSDSLTYRIYESNSLLTDKTKKDIPENQDVVFGGLSAGVYKVSAEYKNCGEEYSNTVEVSVPPALSLNSPTPNESTCVDGNDGSLVIGPTGGNDTYNNIRVRVTGPDSYSESQTYVRGGNDLTFSGMTGGETYDIEIDLEVPENSGNYSCLVSGTADIPNPTQIEIQTDQESLVAPTCPGGDDGFIIFSLNNIRGVSSIGKIWINNSEVNKTASSEGTNKYRIGGLSSGDKVKFIAEDSVNSKTCELSSAEYLIPQNETIPLDINLTGIPGDCYTDDGSIEISLSGGEGPFTIELDGSTIMNGATNEFDRNDFPHTIPGLAPLESHTILVTDDANNGSGSGQECFDEETITIDEVFEISAGERPSPNGNTTYQIRCYDELAPVTFTLSGYGTGQRLAVFDYSNNEIDTLSQSLTGSTGTINFPEGDFIVKGIDQNCTTQNSDSISINRVDNPLEFVVATDTTLFSVGGVDYSVSKFNESDGVIAVEIQGGLSNYTVDLFSDENSNSLETKTQVSPNIPVYFNNLAAKYSNGNLINYKVRVTDQLLCVAESADINLTEPDDLTLNASKNIYKGNFNIKCAGGNDTIFVSSQGGIYPHAFTLINNTTGGIITDTISIDEPTYFSELEAGDYTVELVDKSSNNYDSELRDSDDSILTLEEPSPITYETEMIEPTCYGGNDGSYTVTPSGGVPYAVNEYMINFYNADTVEIQSEITNTSTLVSDSGKYFYTVQDTLSACDTVYHAFDIVEWPRLRFSSLSSEYPLCYGDSTAKLNVEVINGRSADGSYTLELYDSLDALQETVTTTLSGNYQFSSLLSGEYTIIAYDDELCSYTESIYVEERADPLEIAQTEHQASTCANSDNAKIKVYSAGGDGMHYYSIDNGTSWREADSIGPDVNGHLQAIVVFDSLESGGIYEILLKDSNYYEESFGGSCLISKTDTIATTPELVLNWEKENLSCYDATDGSITLFPSYGIEKDLSYFDITISKGGSLYAENTLTLSDLSYGLYEIELSLSATDGCPTVLNDEIFIQRPAAPLNVEVHSTSDYNCASPEDIVVRGEVTGGWPSNGYEYEIDGDGSSFQPFTPLNNTFRFTSSLLIGEHELTVRDSVGCEFSTTFSVEPLRLSMEVLSQSDVSCYGGSDGVLQITSPNGSLDYKLWNTVDSFTLATQDTALFEGIPTGAYQLIATSNTCTSDTLNVEFTSPEELHLTYNILSQPTCGEANGHAQTTINGGVAPYKTNWLYEGVQLLEPDALMAGDYIVIVEDSQGCQLSDSIYIEEETNLTVTVSDISTSTCGLNNASVSLEIQGGVPTYAVEWFNENGELVGDNVSLTAIKKGNYRYKVSDQRECFVEDTVFVDGDEALEIALRNTSEATCGIANGSATLAVSGGNSPYTVSWPTTIPVTSGLSASGLEGGIVYEVLVADSTGCEKPFKFSINNTSGPQVEVSQFNPSCGLNNGEIEITSISGKAPFDIKWNSIADTSRIQTSLAAGSYQITVTDSDSCSTTEIVELKEDLINQLHVSDNVSPSSCGGNNGSINLQISGGYKPYQVKWADNATIEDTLRTNLAAGTYNVTITDSIGCEINQSIILNEVASPSLTVESFDQASCGEENGQLVLNQLSDDYRYHWSHDESVDMNSADNLGVGRYDVYADNGSCTTDTISFYISSPNSDINISVAEIIAATCESTYDGAVEISINGGVAPYEISWDDELNQDTERVANLLPGTYSVLVTDASGCAAVKSVTVGTVNPVYIAGFNETSPSCYSATDGRIEVLVAGGTGNYSYIWSTGDSTKIINGVEGGNYSVEVFDNDGCAVNQDITLKAPDSLSLSAEVLAPRCYESSNGSAEVNVSGGSPPYSVVWPDGSNAFRRYDLQSGEYNLEVTDDKGCALTKIVTIPAKDSVIIAYNIDQVTCYNSSDANIELTAISNAKSPLVRWSNGQVGKVLRNVSAGVYTATITDVNGCPTLFDFTVTEPDLLAIDSIEAAGAKCNGASNGSIIFDVIGGTAPYSYRWSDGATTKTRAGLSAGNYQVLITDNMGCVIEESFEIEQPDPLSIDYELAGISCFGSSDGSASIEVSGGNAPYQISWPDGTDAFVRNDLTAGSYDVTITDANNCMLVQEISIDNINPIEIDQITKNPPSCYQGADGSITIDVTGGSGDYAIVWDNDSQGTTIDNIAAGIYSVFIRDSNGCEFNASIRLDDTAPINISKLVKANPICYNEPSGMVAITPSGGSAPYKAIWEDGVEALERNDLLAGTHNFTIQDAEGCTTDYEVTLEDPPLEELTDLPELVYLCSGGYINLDAGEWNTYSWSSENGFSSTDREVTIDAAGDYYVEVTNEAGCIDSHEIEVIKDDDLLKADFLLTTEAVVGDTVLIIDISWPMPDSVRWNNPDDKDFYLLSQGADYQEVIFTRAGEFEMSMKANLDQCEAHVKKTINVLSAEEAARLRKSGSDNSEGKLHLSTNMYPNPNYGAFRLEVEGNQLNDINVRIVDQHKGYEYYQLSGKQQQKHVFNIRDNRLPPGVYIAIVEVEGQTITKRFVVK